MDACPATLSKKERLSGKNSISALLDKGKWGNCSQLKYCYRKDSGEPVNRIMVSVPKRFFKRAVKRNLLKRRIRESFRTQKSLLPEKGGIDLLIQYNTPEILDYASLHSLMGCILEQIR